VFLPRVGLIVSSLNVNMCVCFWFGFIKEYIPFEVPKNVYKHYIHKHTHTAGDGGLDALEHGNSLLMVRDGDRSR